ncbi:unnamed protein product [Ostreobium quekettii]|uniref:DNA2/NAM7 helicase helicase domain-containing protein n=1 Tax=Ostreobium quekettii TaxID=121088 RepID=A0A8S1IPF6_9CHLO|nr:unnamed protein product [Ostreobium quekettii]
MADDHSAQEGALLERWADANDAEGRKKWFQDASRFLMGLPEGGHWFCLHYEVAQRMCELALYHEHEDVQKLFGCIGSSLGDCLDCVDRYHEAQKSYTDADGGDVILHACLCFDAIRLTGLLTGAMDVKAHEDISFKVRSAIHEVLTYSEILEDSEVCSLCSRALLHIDHTHGIDAVIGEGAFYVGVFRLLAHNEESVRQLMRRAADLLPVPTGEYLTALLPLLDKWRHVLEFGLFYGDCDQGLGGGTLMQRVKVFQMKSSLWMGLASVLERILEGGELHNISDGVSALVPIVFQHCNSECSPDVFTWALSSAKMLLDGLKSKIWCSSHLAPLQVAEVFICSSYTGKANTRTHKLCISALSSLLASVESASMLDELEVLRQRVLYFFINQVQASKNFGRVIRAIAQQEAYKRLCQSVKDALPPTSAAHIYGPALIGELVREETQQGGLADRVQASAVEYASLILQVDACILRVLLSSDQVHRDAPSQLLIADGIGNDIEATCEVAVEYKETWRCAPMLWLDLAKCKHPMVSCALLVSAAHLSWVQVNREHLHKEQATKERRVSGGFLINKLESKLEASPMGMLNSIMAWRPCQGWDDAWSRIDIEMKQCPDLLLLKWLEIAVQHLEVLSREKFYPPAEFECRMWSSIVRLATGPDTSLRKAANQWIECSQSKLMIDDDESGGFIGILSGCFSALIELKQIPAEEVAVLPQTAHFFDFLTGLIGVDNPNTHIAAIKTVVKDSWDLVHTVLNTCKALPISNFSRRAVQCSLSSAFKLLVPLYSFRIRNRDKHGGLMVGNEFLRMMWEWGQKQLAQTTCCVWADATCEIGQLFVKSGASTKLPHEVVPLAKEVLKIRGDIDHEKLIKLWSLLGEDAPGNLAEPLFDFLTVKDRGVQDVVDLTESISDDDWATKSGTQRKHSNGSIIGPLASPIVVGTSPDLHLSKQVLDEVQHLPSTEGDADRVSLSQLCNSAFPPVLVSRSPINKAIDATGNAENAKHLGTSKGSSDSDVRKSWAMYERAKSQRGVQGLKQATALSRSCANADDGGPGARAVQCADLERGPSVQSGSGCQQDSSGQLQSLYPFLPSKATKQGGRLAPPSAGQGPKGTIFISPLKGPQGRVVGLPMRPGANTYARPTCSMEAVFEKILAWRIDAIKSEKSDLMFGRRAQVPKVFSTLQQYTNAFEMLLVEELRATLHQGWVELEEGVSSPMSIPVRVDHVQRAPPFYNVTFLLEAADALDRRVVHVDNLLILTDRPLDTKNLPSRHMLALVTNNSNSGNDGNSKLVDMKIKAEGSGTASSHTSRDASYYLRKGSHWHATLLDSLVPHFRQLQALCNLYALPQQLVNTILHPTPPPNSVDLEGTMLPRSMLRALQEVYNPTQQAAIASAVAGRGVFTLVQGPPGTGKTSVIVGMVSALLVSLCSKGPEPRTALEAKRDPAQCHRPTRILICAQSNAAADELLSRISRDGVTCLDGSKRTPTMLRMGRLEETHESVKAFHIKHMCTAAMQKNEDASEATLRTAEHVKQLDELQQQLKQVREEVQRLRSSPLGNNGREPIKPLQGKERQLNSEARKLRSQLYQDNKDVQHHEKHIRRRTLADAEIVVGSAGQHFLGSVFANCDPSAKS